MSFEKDLEKSRIAERITWDILQHSDNNKFVMDVRDAPIFQDMDVDFLWQTNDNKIYFIEVKLDTMINTTGNVVYEVSTNGNIGCFEKTKAHYIFYYDYAGKIMYSMSVNKLKYYAHNGKHNLVKMGDGAEGYLFKVSDLEQLKIIVKKYENME